MAKIIFSLLLGLAPLLTNIVFKILSSLGFGYAVFTGLNVVLTQLHNFILSQIGGASSAIGTASAWLAVVRVDDAITLILSAITVKFLYLGLVNGIAKRLELKSA